MTETTAALRLIDVLEAVAWAKRPCKLCKRDLYFVKKRDGKTAVFTSEGLDHYADCPGVVRRQQRAPEAQDPQGHSKTPSPDGRIGQDRLFPRPPVEALDPIR